MNTFPFMVRPMPALSRGDLSANTNRTRPAWRRGSVQRVNLGKRAELDDAPRAAAPLERRTAPPAPQAAPAPSQPLPPPRPLPIPDLQRPLQRGQKASTGLRQGDGSRLSIAFGWNVKDGRCDVDASAFLLGPDGRVPGDEWFVFYGQPESPDGSVRFAEDGRTDRQVIRLDLKRLDPSIQRIVFVMTINEAIERRLNFGMIQDAWLRMLDAGGREILSYRPLDLFPQITSMTLGELYLHKGEWKFNPVGNGLNIDLAGQCAVYGVDISD